MRVTVLCILAFAGATCALQIPSIPSPQSALNAGSSILGNIPGIKGNDDSSSSRSSSEEDQKPSDIANNLAERLVDDIANAAGGIGSIALLPLNIGSAVFDTVTKEIRNFLGEVLHPENLNPDGPTVPELAVDLAQSVVHDVENMAGNIGSALLEPLKLKAQLIQTIARGVDKFLKNIQNQISGDSSAQDHRPQPSNPQHRPTHRPKPTPSHGHKPTTTRRPKPTSSHGHKPTTTQRPKPTSSHGHKPTTTRHPKPTSSHGPKPTTTQRPKPTSSHGPKPTTTQGPKPTSSHGPQPTTTQGPKPTSSHGPQPTTTQGPRPTSSQGPSTLPPRPTRPNPPSSAPPRPTRPEGPSTPPPRPTRPVRTISRDVQVRIARDVDFSLSTGISVDQVLSDGKVRNLGKALGSVDFNAIVKPIPKIQDLTPLDKLPALPGLASAIGRARDHVIQIVAAGAPTIEKAIQIALNAAIASANPAAGIVNLVNIIVQVYVFVAQSALVIAPVAEAVLKEAATVVGSIVSSLLAVMSDQVADGVRALL
ncbi:uncharacterized protein LOC143213584 [Lasioglossum baleicum]|uniref:uncharacterized protein LOC143213584 n=1 Tax=Lasioglossum baleicum TaxID=434251 RepID=UPI003FCE8B20